MSDLMRVHSLGQRYPLLVSRSNFATKTDCICWVPLGRVKMRFISSATCFAVDVLTIMKTPGPSFSRRCPPTRIRMPMSLSVM